MLHAQVELLGVGVAAVRRHREEAADRIVGDGREIGRHSVGKAVLDPAVIGRELVYGHRVVYRKGRIAMHPVKSAAGAGGVVEEAEAAAHNGARKQLIGEPETRCKKLVLGLNSYVSASVEAGNQHLASEVVQIHKAIGDLYRRW